MCAVRSLRQKQQKNKTNREVEGHISWRGTIFICIRELRGYIWLRMYGSYNGLGEAYGDVSGKAELCERDVFVSMLMLS